MFFPCVAQTVVVDRGERWDCESVLSLRSNLENHPGTVEVFPIVSVSASV